MKKFYKGIISSSWFEWLIIVVILAVTAFIYLFFNTQGTYEQIFHDYRQGVYYRILGEQIMAGKFYTPGFIGGDWSEFDGRYYLYHGPLPAVVWVFFKTYIVEVSVNMLTWIMSVINIFLFYLLLRKVVSNILLRFAFVIVYACGPLLFMNARNFVYETSIIFGSTFLIASVLVFFKQYEKEKNSTYRKLLLLIATGLLLSFAFLSRVNLLLSFIPFLLLIGYQEKKDFYKGWFYISIFVAAVGVGLLTYGFYNSARFYNPFDFGVTHVITSSEEDNSRLRSGDSTSVHYLVRNVYHTFFLIPEVNLREPPYIFYSRPEWLVGHYPRLVNTEWVSSIFYSSPLLLFIFGLWLYRKKIKEEQLKLLVLIGGIIPSAALPTFFFMGFTRRYHQDYYPFILVLAALGAMFIWNYYISRKNSLFLTGFAALICIAVLWTGVIAFHLNCIYVFNNDFKRCIMPRQPIEWFVPLY